MEESQTLPAQTDFLDLRHTLAELAGGAFTLLCALVLSLYAAVCALCLALDAAKLGTAGLCAGGIWLLLILVSALALWLLYFKGRKDELCGVSLKLLRITPIVEIVLAVPACLVMVAALIVVIFSNATVHASLLQLSEALSGSYFVFLGKSFAFFGNLPFPLLIAVFVLAALLLFFLTLRHILLAAFLHKLDMMREKNAPMKSFAGFLTFLSCLFGLLCGLLASSVCRVNLMAGLCLACYALSLVSEGLLLYRVTGELHFLNTYYAKLNRAMKRRADAIRAQKEALMNAPLAIAAGEASPEASPTVDDIPAGADAPDVIVPPVPEAPAAPDVVGVPETQESTSKDGKNVNNAEKESTASSQNEEINV